MFTGGFSHVCDSLKWSFLFADFKTTHLDKALFITPDLLPRAYFDPAREGSKVVNELIHLTNLVTFLYLVLASGPDPVTKSRPRTGSDNLKRASLDMLKTVAKSTHEIDEASIRLVVDLKRQVSLARFVIPLLSHEC